MKLTFFIQDFRGGGAQHMIINTANEFARRGKDVDLLVVNTAGPHRNKVAGNVRIVDLGKSRSLAALWTLARYISRSKPDILISAMTHSNLLAILARFFVPFSPTRLVVTERTFLSVHIKKTSSFMDKILGLGVLFLYRFADKVVGISQGVAEDIKHLGHLDGRRVTHIYNPVITDEMRKSYDSETPVSFKDDTSTVILTSGRLSFEKDHATLLNGFALIRKTINAKLVILGDGPLKAELQTKAKKLGVDKDVIFAGFVTHPIAYMKAADLFVMTSLYEGFCNVIVEALYSGLPVVSTDCPSGPREILDFGKYGRLVPVGNAERLADAMISALNEPRNFQQSRERAETFTVEKICDEYLQLFSTMQKRKQ